MLVPAAPSPRRPAASNRGGGGRSFEDLRATKRSTEPDRALRRTYTTYGDDVIAPEGRAAAECGAAAVLVRWGRSASARRTPAVDYIATADPGSGGGGRRRQWIVRLSPTPAGTLRAAHHQRADGRAARSASAASDPTKWSSLAATSTRGTWERGVGRPAARGEALRREEAGHQAARTVLWTSEDRIRAAAYGPDTATRRPATTGDRVRRLAPASLGSRTLRADGDGPWRCSPRSTFRRSARRRGPDIDPIAGRQRAALAYLGDASLYDPPHRRRHRGTDRSRGAVEGHRGDRRDHLRGRDAGPDPEVNRGLGGWGLGS